VVVVVEEEEEEDLLCVHWKIVVAVAVATEVAGMKDFQILS
jgi:hypothetical protein